MLACCRGANALVQTETPAPDEWRERASDSLRRLWIPSWTGQSQFPFEYWTIDRNMLPERPTRHHAARPGDADTFHRRMLAASQ